ncbi:MAG: hypothetical protein JSS49_14010 [Planctomycetes bacterium]|nr:hypothetical protein [Planctomycetota bacterium]
MTLSCGPQKSLRNLEKGNRECWLIDSPQIDSIHHQASAGLSPRWGCELDGKYEFAVPLRRWQHGKRG